MTVELAMTSSLPTCGAGINATTFYRVLFDEQIAVAFLNETGSGDRLIDDACFNRLRQPRLLTVLQLKPGVKIHALSESASGQRDRVGMLRILCSSFMSGSENFAVQQTSEFRKGAGEYPTIT